MFIQIQGTKLKELAFRSASIIAHYKKMKPKLLIQKQIHVERDRWHC